MIDKKRILNILEKCLEIKKYGVDVFFRYAPHIQGIDVHIHKGGWESEGPEDYSVYVDEEGNLYEEKRLEALEERLEELLREVKK